MKKNMFAVHYEEGFCPSYPRHYKVYVTYVFHGLVIYYISADDKVGLNEFVGYIVLNSLEKIERIDFQEVK